MFDQANQNLHHLILSGPIDQMSYYRDPFGSKSAWSHFLKFVTVQSRNWQHDSWI